MKSEEILVDSDPTQLKKRERGKTRAVNYTEDEFNDRSVIIILFYEKEHLFEAQSLICYANDLVLEE